MLLAWELAAFSSSDTFEGIQGSSGHIERAWRIGCCQELLRLDLSLETTRLVLEGFPLFIPDRLVLGRSVLQHLGPQSLGRLAPEVSDHHGKWRQTAHYTPETQHNMR